MNDYDSDKKWFVLLPEWMFDDARLSLTHMVTLALIDSLSRRGHCFASSKWIGKRLRKSPGHIDNLISELKEMGLLRTKKDRAGNRLLKVRFPTEASHEKLRSISGKAETPPHEKLRSPLRSKAYNKNDKRVGADTPSSRSLLSDSDDVKKQTPATVLADAFLEFAIEEHLLTISKRRKPAISKWYAAAEELIESNSIKRIRQVMQWYFEEWKDEWLPSCRSFPTFAEKFLQIEKAMVRKHPDRKRSASKRAGELTTLTLASGKQIQVRESA